MKKLFILSAIAFGGLIYTTADAQIRVGVNLGYAQGPAVQANPAFGNGYDDYFYLPDLGVYYDATTQCYFYFDGTEWVSSPYLPGQYANYDWRSARRFEIRAFRPYLHDDFYRERYNGNRFAGWDRGNYDRDRVYANRGDRDGDRNFDHDRYDRNDGYNRDNNQHFDANRDVHNGGQFENRGQGAYTRQPQQNRDNNQGFDNKGRGFDKGRNDQNKNTDHGRSDQKGRGDKFSQ